MERSVQDGELLRFRAAQYRWFARRYRDEAAEEAYCAEEARRSNDPGMESVHREGAASAIRVARFYEREAETLERRLDFVWG